MEQLETLKQWIQESNRIVFFGGAGVSTESGIPDFRSVDGLYNQKFEYLPETIISHSFYEQWPEYFFAFTVKKCCPLALNRTSPIKSLHAGSRRENSAPW